MDYYGSPEKLLNSHINKCYSILLDALSSDGTNHLFLAETYSEILWCIKQIMAGSCPEINHSTNDCKCEQWLIINSFDWVILKEQELNDKIGLKLQDDPEDCWLLRSLKKNFILQQHLDHNNPTLSRLEEDCEFLKYGLIYEEINKELIPTFYYDILKNLESYLGQKCPALDHSTSCTCERVLLFSNKFTTLILLDDEIDKVINLPVECDSAVCWLKQKIEKYRLLCFITGMGKKG